MPGPYSQYIIGNFSDFIGAPDEVFKKIRLLAARFKVYKVWMGYTSAVNTYRPDDVELVVANTQNITKSLMYKPLWGWLNTGLLTSGGKKWHTRRKILTPAFHFSILQQFTDTFIQQTENLIKKLEKHVGDEYVDVVPYITNFTLNSITETAMGTKTDENNPKQMAYRKSMHEFSKLVVHRILRPWLYPTLTWMVTPEYWYERKLIKTMHAFTDNVVRERQNLGRISKDKDHRKRRLAMLDLLLSAKNEGMDIDYYGIREEVDTFTFEGHDTTSVSICFTLLLLASHQDIQDRVYQEIDDIFDRSDRPATYEELQNMSYLEMCIKESLRMYPSVPLISRLAGADLETFDGYKIPKNTHIHIHIYDLHHDPDIYPEPEKFDPDRFLPEVAQNRHPFAYLPFSGGPRNCIEMRIDTLFFFQGKSLLCSNRKLSFPAF
ncbi:cytochrome p450 [Rhyzopertha dominica]|nr:cytochrome p450 [Rhyzopertha dominica]